MGKHCENKRQGFGKIKRHDTSEIREETYSIMASFGLGNQRWNHRRSTEYGSPRISVESCKSLDFVLIRNVSANFMVCVSTM